MILILKLLMILVLYLVLRKCIPVRAANLQFSETGNPDAEIPPSPAQFPAAETVSDWEEQAEEPTEQSSPEQNNAPPDISAQQPLPPQTSGRAANYTDIYAPRPGMPVQHPVSRPPAIPVERKPKKPFSPIPLLLIAGVCFLFLGGIIFLSATWDTLPGVVRALILLLASMIFFGANILAERVMKLPKTGLAFYTLGCIFLPLTIVGIGIFDLMGEWFSFDGGGSLLVWTMTCLCIAIPGMIGQKNYNNPFLAWMGLTGFSTAWMFVISFLSGQMMPTENNALVLTNILLLLFAAASTVGMERYLRSVGEARTPIAKAAPFSLYTQNVLYSGFILALAYTEQKAFTMVLALLMGVLFLYPRYISQNFHAGVIGFYVHLLITFTMLRDIIGVETASPAFIMLCTSFVLMAFRGNRYLPEATVHTCSTAGLLSGLVLTVPCLIAEGVLLNAVPNLLPYALFLLIPLCIGILHFAGIKKNPLAEDTLHFCTFALLLYSTGILIQQQSETAKYLEIPMILAAAVLIGWFFLRNRLWSLVLSICTCLSMVTAALPHSTLWMNWLCTIAALGAMVYARRFMRPLLETCCTMLGISLFLLSMCQTAELWITHSVSAHLFTFLILAIVYLPLRFLFWKEQHHETSKQFTENIAVYLSFALWIDIFVDSVPLWHMIGFALLCLFVAGTCFRRPLNALSIVPLMAAFFTLHSVISQLTDGSWHDLVFPQVFCYFLIFLAFAAFGRILQPKGFLINQNGVAQVDWALVVGVFPVFCMASVIDWYPSILICLFLSVYSLLYIGRTKSHRIPVLMTSCFLCLTLFFHNCHDPFHILGWLDKVNMKSPQTLLVLLPAHLFILSLLWILPQAKRNSVHLARFCMYCVTMFTLLVESLNFGLAEDGIVLAVFSLLILFGSFAVKRLRWFTLGFSVLFLMTLQMTGHFWRSLHWGIYLFLAGALLIAAAFYYEYAVKKHHNLPEQPEETKPQRIRLFKEWTW